jgi:hypothetical protein
MIHITEIKGQVKNGTHIISEVKGQNWTIHITVKCQGNKAHISEVKGQNGTIHINTEVKGKGKNGGTSYLGGQRSKLNGSLYHHGGQSSR